MVPCPGALGDGLQVLEDDFLGKIGRGGEVVVIFKVITNLLSTRPER